VLQIPEQAERKKVKPTTVEAKSLHEVGDVITNRQGFGWWSIISLVAWVFLIMGAVSLALFLLAMSENNLVVGFGLNFSLLGISAFVSLVIAFGLQHLVNWLRIRYLCSLCGVRLPNEEILLCPNCRAELRQCYGFVDATLPARIFIGVLVIIIVVTYTLLDIYR
jgi:hypothetical protein